MTNERWSKLIGIIIFVFAFFIPLIVILTYYVSLEPTTPTQATNKIAIGTIGYILLVLLFFGGISLLKKRIKTRQELGFKISPYYINFSKRTFTIVLLITFTLFLLTIRTQIETLITVFMVIMVSEIIAYALTYVQIYFDKKVLDESSSS